MSSFVQAFVAALLASVSTIIGHWALTYFQARKDEAKFLREKLHDRYSELVAIACAEIRRSRELSSMIATETKESANQWMNARFATLEEQRHQIQLDLDRISLQIRLLERDPNLASRVKALAKAQPFLAYAWPPKWGEGNFDKRFDSFQHEIGQFEQQLTEISDAIVLKHSVVLNVTIPK